MSKQEEQRQQDIRRVFVIIRATEQERAIMHDAARAQGFDSLADFTRAGWHRMLTGSGSTQTQSPAKS